MYFHNRYRVIVNWGGAALVILVAGCGRQAEEGARVETVEEVAPLQTPMRGTHHEEPMPHDTAAEGVLSAPFRVASIYSIGDDQWIAGLVSMEDETVQHLVREGDRILTYHVAEIEADRDRVWLTSEGQRYVAYLRGAPVAANQAEHVQAERTVILTEPVEVYYERTQHEWNANIDPNDPDTWPEDYRGPDIERAGFPPIYFEPLDFEVEQGIDPNDPATWPEEYRGPGIERALRR